jgi:hypothetical protein
MSVIMVRRPPSAAPDRPHQLCQLGVGHWSGLSASSHSTALCCSHPRWRFPSSSTKRTAETSAEYGSQPIDTTQFQSR